MSAVICALGAWVTLRLASRAMHREGKQRLGWIVLAAVAGGSAIWCTHFIGMLAYQPPAAIRFEPILTMVSLLVAIAGTAAGFYCAISWRKAPEFGGVIVGIAIASMHYIGMRAYLVDGIVFWDWNAVALSWIFSITFSLLAMRHFVRQTSRRSPHIAVAMLAAAVVLLHYTGMASVTVLAVQDGNSATDPAILIAMAVAVAAGAIVIISTGIVSHLIDDEASKENIAHLRYLALNDGLTDLPNRVAFGEHLAREMRISERDSFKLAVIGIDLNRFKEVNDLKGHLAGDRVLKTIGHRFGELCRDGEFVSRVGGDEFYAVKRSPTQSDLLEFLNRLEGAVIGAVGLDETEVSVGASIGVAVYPDDGGEAETLVNNADLAMYRAKADPTRTVCFYEERMDEAVRERRNLSLDLREALAAGQFELYYQVQNSVATGEITGYEALLRWRHPVRGLVAPMDFISIAEENGSIVNIGDWVLRTACRAAAAWSKPYKIAINISPVQFTNANLSRLVHQVLIESGLKPERLELEITESAIIADKTLALHTLRTIRAMGVTVAIDDFGTGYSSLDTLRSFPFDKIKLDRSFIAEAERDPQAKAIIRAVLAIGRSLNVGVLAEGVESSGQLELLRIEGCDEAQGFYLGMPKPIGDIPSQVEDLSETRQTPLQQAG